MMSGMIIRKRESKVMNSHVKFSTGSTPFLLLILMLVLMINTRTAVASTIVGSGALHGYQVDFLQTTPPTILHGPLTALNGSRNRHVRVRKMGGEPVEPAGFPTDAGILSRRRSKSFPSTSSSSSSLALPSYASSLQYSGQVAEQNGSRWKRNGLSGNMTSARWSNAAAGVGATEAHSAHSIFTTSRHKNSLHKRSTQGISPPFLFLKIFMDYSSPNEEDLMGERVGKSDLPIRRRRAHHTIRTFNGEEQVVTLHINEKNTSSVIPPISTSPNRNSSLSGGDDVYNNATHPNYTGGIITAGGNNASSSTTITSSSTCPVGQFGCTSDPSLCVPQAAICNGKPECPDGSDEYKCVNMHEKKFWDSFFQKRPASDDNMEGGHAKRNDTCLYKVVGNTDEEQVENKLGPVVERQSQEAFSELLGKGLCRCSQEKVLCHNVHLPNLEGFPEEIKFLDLSGCRIDKLELGPGRFQLLETLVLSSCSIRELTPETFSFLPSLKILHLTGNHLRRIHPSTFSGNGNLTKLFLGHNQLETIDSQSFHGLGALEYLDLRKNQLTGEDSNVFEALGSLRILHLSYNEIRTISTDFLSGLAHLEMLSLTKNKISTISVGALNHMPLLKHLYLSYNRLSVLENGMFCSLQDLLNLNLNDNGIRRMEPKAFECLDSLQSLILEKNPFRDLELDVADDEDGGGGGGGAGSSGRDPRELFANLTNLQHIYFDEWWMCWWAPHVRSCSPKGDGISSVDNLLDNVILRVCVWIMGSVGVGGNLFVIISRLVIREKNKAHSFYIKNLAVADLLMGLFLLSIAFHDMSFRGHFLAHQHAWRHSFTCQISGMLSTLSSESSVLILFLITLDRYLSIVRPFAEKTNALIPAMVICTGLWMVSVGLSYAPLLSWFRGYFGKSFYSSNGLCLPLHIHNPYETGWEYSLFLFIVINSVAFTFICYAYWRMLRIIQTSTTSIRSTQQKQDGMLVKRFGLVVFTDFICWFPIILIKCVAMAGVDIQSDLYAWLAVFVLPVNSALNPVIYTLSTKLFKQQVSHITVGFRKRLGLATDESTGGTSSFFYRNRISRTLQTSMNSSMMYSTRRSRSDSTRVTVLKDRMAMSNRLSSKVGAGYSPPGQTATGAAGVICVSATDASGATSGDHVIPNGGRHHAGGGGDHIEIPKVTEINGQIAQQEDEQQQQLDGSEKDMMMTVVVESQL